MPTRRIERSPRLPRGLDAVERFAARGFALPRSKARVPRQLGSYTLQNVIGRGGMGVVYRAVHTELGTPFAVKVLREGALATPTHEARFKREAKALARLDKHPNLVAVHHLGREGGILYCVMDLVEGESLRKRLKGYRFTPEETAALIEKVARALHLAHERRLVHRDIKPSNILLRGNEPQVVDFGLALDLAGTRLTQAGRILGTPQYMAPEQACGRTADRRSDVWSLGAVMYEMLTGKSVHRGRNVAEVLRAVREGRVLAAVIEWVGVPRALALTCLKCLRHDPAERYPTAEALADDLALHLRHAGGPAPSNVEGPAPSNVEGPAPNKAEGSIPNQAEGIVPSEPARTAAPAARAPRRRPRRQVLEPKQGAVKDGEVLGGYRVLHLLGRGAMGEVYLGEQLSLERLVALKVLSGARDPEFVKRFHREIGALASLSHPNIVSIIDRGSEGDRLFYAMEYVDGVSLRYCMERYKPSEKRILKYGVMLCDALEHAHFKGIVHRDLKPENILIKNWDIVKVLDFGVSRMLKGRDRTDVIRKGRARRVVGTMDYAAPEQIADPSSVDAKADLYSLGVILYEMLTGDLPHGAFKPPSAKCRLGYAIDHVLLPFLREDPAQRHPHAGYFRTGLQLILRDLKDD